MGDVAENNVAGRGRVSRGCCRGRGHKITVEVVRSVKVVVRDASGDSVADVAGPERLQGCLLRTRLWEGAGAGAGAL